jgi:hypothetical protein
MAFFGLTMLGSNCPFDQCLLKNLNLSSFDDEELSSAFDLMLSRDDVGEEQLLPLTIVSRTYS